jgi:hypothetical protein
MYVIPLIVALIAPSLSLQDRQEAVMFIQSRDVPKLFETCKRITPDRSSAYDVAWQDWQKRHRVEIERGEKVFRQTSQGEGKDPDAYLKNEIEILPAAIRGMPPAEQIERCNHALGALREES